MDALGAAEKKDRTDKETYGRATETAYARVKELLGVEGVKATDGYEENKRSLKFKVLVGVGKGRDHPSNDHHYIELALDLTRADHYPHHVTGARLGFEMPLWLRRELKLRSCGYKIKADGSFNEEKFLTKLRETSKTCRDYLAGRNEDVEDIEHILGFDPEHPSLGALRLKVSANKSGYLIVIQGRVDAEGLKDIGRFVKGWDQFGEEGEDGG